jgi:uncharacterized lipoprotein NlpE involved in copper resistance
MKQLITVFAVIAITLFGCDKQASNQLAKEEMTATELKEKHGIVLPFVDYGVTTSSAIDLSKGGETSRSKKPKANAVVLVVWFNDLTLTESGGVLTTTLSPNAEWAGVQKWITVDTTNNAVSLCNWNWSNSTAPATITCNGAVTGFQYRSWTSDKVTYDVHVSPFLPL